MNKIQSMALSAVFAVSASVFNIDTLKAQVYSQNSDIKTDFTGLQDGAGNDFDESVLEGKYPLIFFGTAYNTPSCESVFGNQKIMIESLLAQSGCANLKDEIFPIFIYPEVQGTNKNSSNISSAKKSGFEALSGDPDTVKGLAKKYGTSYFSQDADGDWKAHSSFMYLQGEGPDGGNILIYSGRVYSGQAAPHVVRAIEKDGFDCSPN